MAIAMLKFSNIEDLYKIILRLNHEEHLVWIADHSLPQSWAFFKKTIKG